MLTHLRKQGPTSHVPTQPESAILVGLVPKQKMLLLSFVKFSFLPYTYSASFIFQWTAQILLPAWSFPSLFQLPWITVVLRRIGQKTPSYWWSNGFCIWILYLKSITVAHTKVQSLEVKYQKKGCQSIGKKTFIISTMSCVFSERKETIGKQYVWTY